MKKKLIAVLAAVALILSVFSVLAIPAFADDDDDAPIMLTSTGEGSEEDTTEAEDENVEEGNTEDKGEDADTESEGDVQTTGNTETTGDTETTDDASGDNVVDDPFDLEESKGLSTEAIWNIVLGGIALAAVAAAAVVFFVLPKRREKTLKFCRSLKSEWKKISWYSWKQTWKGTLVVAIVSIVIAVVIGLLDTGFSQGLNALAKFF